MTDRAAVRLAFATTCSDRKAIVASGQVALREIPRGPAADRAKKWAAALAKAATATTQADRLYLGPHWSSSKRAFDAAREAGFDAKMHVISAGYGLYPIEALVTSYAATFVPGHRDSVAHSKLNTEERDAYLDEWWTHLAKYITMPDGTDRTFAQMAARDPDQRILVVAGGHYLDAICSDLAEARSKLSVPDYLAVVSAGASVRAARQLEGSLLPVDARFEHVVAGARTALNARIAVWLLEGVVNVRAVGAEYFRRKLEATTATLPPARTFDRKQMDDHEVRIWIIRNSRRPEAASASAMLRFLRSSELACEQKRFGGLYRQAMASLGRQAK